MISECKNMYIEKVDRKCYRTERRMELYYIKCSMGSFDKRKGGGGLLQLHLEVQYHNTFTREDDCLCRLYLDV